MQHPQKSRAASLDHSDFDNVRLYDAQTKLRGHVTFDLYRILAQFSYVVQITHLNGVLTGLMGLQHYQDIASRRESAIECLSELAEILRFRNWFAMRVKYLCPVIERGIRQCEMEYML